jgi:hypothetical protein
MSRSASVGASRGGLGGWWGWDSWRRQHTGYCLSPVGSRARGVQDGRPLQILFRGETFDCVGECVLLVPGESREIMKAYTLRQLQNAGWAISLRDH